MSEAARSPMALPEIIAVFPLPGVLLLPQGRLPLNIFEPRYKAMTEDALAVGRVFGMIQTDPSRPDTAAGPALYRVGCLGRIMSFSETEDGRYLITLTGVIRFAVAAELEMRRGYRRVSADYDPYHDDLDAIESGAPADRRQALLAALRVYFSHRGITANWESINQMPYDSLVTTLCMACPFDPAERQALLEAPGPAERADTLMTLLQIDSHGTPDDGEADRIRVS